MAIKVTEYELTSCYKCGETTLAVVGQVHPLCEKCGTEFDTWFSEQLKVFGE